MDSLSVRHQRIQKRVQANQRKTWLKDNLKFGLLLALMVIGMGLIGTNDVNQLHSIQQRDNASTPMVQMPHAVYPQSFDQPTPGNT
jgi:predicted negative regulator of RcsB-dependent stress response